MGFASLTATIYRYIWAVLSEYMYVEIVRKHKQFVAKWNKSQSSNWIFFIGSKIDHAVHFIGKECFRMFHVASDW